MSVELMLGDCLELMPTLPDGSIDLILADLPYGTTACKWDTIIPLDALWAQYKRLIKRNGAIVLFGAQPFTTTLIASNMGMYRYCWYWYKNSPVGFQMAHRQPMRAVEDLCVFYFAQPTYNVQRMKTRITDRNVRDYQQNGRTRANRSTHSTISMAVEHPLMENVLPWNVLEFPVVPRANGTLHPTQKPVALMEYLIRTYTNEGETVLDNCMGSGTTLVAAINTGRNGIGIERDATYFSVAQKRVQEAQQAARQLTMELTA